MPKTSVAESVWIRKNEHFERLLVFSVSDTWIKNQSNYQIIAENYQNQFHHRHELQILTLHLISSLWMKLLEILAFINPKSQRFNYFIGQTSKFKLHTVLYYIIDIEKIATRFHDDEIEFDNFELWFTVWLILYSSIRNFDLTTFRRSGNCLENINILRESEKIFRASEKFWERLKFFWERL